MVVLCNKSDSTRADLVMEWDGNCEMELRKGTCGGLVGT
jgi:hypothetical protein